MILPRRNLGLTLMIALLALAAAGKAVLYDTLDPDAFWHLRVAEQLTQQGIGPIVDDLSYSSIKSPWTPYSWLAELGMKWLWDFGGYRAAVLGQALMMGGFVVFVALCAYEMCRRTTGFQPVSDTGTTYCDTGASPVPARLEGKETARRSTFDHTSHGQDGGVTGDSAAPGAGSPCYAGNPIAVILATAFAMYLSLPYLSFRPVTFAFVLLAACAWLILRDRRMSQQSRAVWLIVPFTILITNCHLFSILVPLWIGALLAGAIWEQTAASMKRYALMLLAVTIACTLTPMLPGAIGTMWSYSAADPMVRPDGIIAELHPLWIDPVAMVVVIGFIAMAVYHRRRFSLGEWLWMGGMLILYARMSRMAPAFVPMAAAMLAIALPRMGHRALARPAICGAVATILLIGIVRLSIAFPVKSTPLSAWLNRHGPDTPGYPCAAADFVAMRIQRTSGRLINEFSWGGYLAWRLQDEYQILLDGRTQLYPPDFWESTYLSTPADCRAALAGTRADAAILPAAKSRFRQPLLDLGWQIAYRDDRAEVLLPPPAMNASINE